MKTWAWLSLCFACLSWGYFFGAWVAYVREMKRMRKRADDEMRRMDEMAGACKKQIEYAYQSAARMMGIDITTDGTR